VLVPSQAASKPGSGGTSVAVQALNRAYVAALQAVHLIPILLPTGDQVPEDLSWVCGLLLPGGPDVDPLRYRQDLNPATEPDPESDELEFALLEWALSTGLPILAICRGMQVLNVALGGTLIQDLPEHLPRSSSAEHPRRDETVHALRVAPGSRLSQIVQADQLAVNSLHHQGVDQLASELTPVGWSPDGLVEAVEIAGDRFVLGVQYHPEELAPQDGHAAALFQAFANACYQGSSNRRDRSAPELAEAL